jgi:hypothetical protein
VKTVALVITAAKGYFAINTTSRDHHLIDIGAIIRPPPCNPIIYVANDVIVERDGKLFPSKR